MKRSRQYQCAAGIALTVAAFLLPVKPIEAATLFSSEVQIVRERGQAAIYALVAGQKYRFRSPDLFASYAYQKPIVSKEPGTLARYPDVQLIQSTLGPRVYLLAPRGQKLWGPGDSLSQSGYSPAKAVTLSHTDIRAYRNALLVREADHPAVYYLDYATLTRAPFLSADDFVRSGFSWSDVVVAPRAVIEAFSLTSAVVPGSLTPSPQPTPIDGPSLRVESVPRGTVTLASGTARNPLWDIELTASKTAVAVQSLTFRKQGLLSDSAIRDITIVDSEGYRLTRPQSVVVGQATLPFLTPLHIPAGETKRLSILVGMSEVTDDLSSFTLALDASGISANASVSGSFPLTSPGTQVIRATGFIGRLIVDAVEVSLAPRDAVIGTTDVVLNTFTLTAENTKTDLVIDSLVFTALGGSPLNFGKYRIVDSHGKAYTVRATVDHSTVVVDFGKTPLRIPYGTTVTIHLRADVIGGANQTSQFVIMNDYDIIARASSGGYAISPAVGSHQSGFPVGNLTSAQANAIHILPGQVLVSINSSSPTGSVTAGADGVVLAAYDVRALGQARELSRLSLAVASRGARTPLRGAVSVRIKGGAVIGSIDSALVFDRTGVVSMSIPPSIASGKTTTIDIVASIAPSATITDAYTVTISNIEFTTPGTSDRVTFATALTAADRIVQSLALLVRLDPKFTPAPAVGGKTGVKLGRFLFRAGAGESITIEQVTFVANASPVSFNEGFSNLKFAGKTIAAPTGNTYTFTLNSNVSANSETGYDLTVDSTPAANGKTVQLSIQKVIARSSASKGAVAISLESSETPSILFQATEASMALDTSFSGGAVARAKGVVVGRFTITAAGLEDAVLSNVVIAGTASSGNFTVTRGYKNLRLVNTATKGTVSSTVTSPIGGTGGNQLNSGPTVKAGQTMTIQVVVDAESVTTPDAIQLQLVSATVKGKTTGILGKASGLPLSLQTVQF